MTTEISVILATHNRAALIGAAIASIRAQSHTNWELIVVNDGSTDATAAGLREAAASDARVRVITQTNHGKAHALNVGIQAAQGEFIAIQDDDDISSPERLAICLAAMRAHPRWDALTHWERFFDERGRKLFWARRAAQRFYRRALWERVGGYRPFFRALEDLDFELRSEEAQRRLGRVRRVLYHARSARAEHTKSSAYMTHLTLRPQTSSYWLAARAGAVLRRAELPDIVTDGRNLDETLAILAHPDGGVPPRLWHTQILPLVRARTAQQLKYIRLGRIDGEPQAELAQLQRILQNWNCTAAERARVAVRLATTSAWARARRLARALASR